MYYERRPIRTLIPLAAHLVFSAAALNPVSIGGLEIVLCDDSGIHRLPAADIAELEQKSKQLHQKLRKSLAKYPQ